MDVGLIEFIYKWIIEMCDVGVFVIVVFMEFDEVVVFVDWIVVMYCGMIVGIVFGDMFWEMFGFMMVGVVEGEVVV